MNNSTLFSRTQAARRIAAACGVGVLLLGAGACGSSDPKAANQATTTTENGNGASVNQQGNQRPGTDGKIAAVADDTAQVQSVANGQVAVSWTSSTTFTKQVSAALADIKVGDCVMVTSASTGTSGGTSTTPPAQPTEVTATSVRISEPVDGSCAPGGAFGGPGGGGPQAGTGDGPQFQGGPGQGGGAPGQPPAGADGAPGGAGQFRGLGGAFGTVKSVSAHGFVVESVRPALGGDEADQSAAPVQVTVTVAGTTTYTTTAKGSAADVKVGQCLRADGQADDTGAVTATTIAITRPTDGECGVGPGGISVPRGNGSGSGTDSGQAS